ncbi:PREDICTED: uncharacterized protein LOC105456611 [Wasmannia auropunctata]|uniref:uncharacterized protein LOC105456611 n=1 Tax=Wasmannia auropunctata TaxID=64793 RepID=UPI0005EF9B2F|nr:PREDICTED: uncharacterized protein LOC105456611 [Wasmannia auropunctata]
MKALLVICAAAIFHTTFTASRSDEDHEVQISTKTQDVERKADNARLLHDQISTTIVPSDEEGDLKRREKACCSRNKNRAHRPRKLKSRNSTRGDKGGIKQQTNRISLAARISNASSRTRPKSKNSRKGNKGTKQRANRFSFEMDLFGESNLDKNDDADVVENIRETLDDYYPFHGGLESLLARLVEALGNSSKEGNNSKKVNNTEPDASNSSAVIDEGVVSASEFDEEDRCQKWLDVREKIERAFPGSVADLPACPCLYPSVDIFYDHQGIWDKKRDKKFAWRDVSKDKDRMGIYKSGAVYCVQTLPTLESESAAAQHCCYDENRKLLTRGSGAGTPYIVSPDISSLLHDKIDLLPWRLCKGDFTRYNEARVPNNGNECEVNPDDEEYQRQVEKAKNY